MKIIGGTAARTYLDSVNDRVEEFSNLVRRVMRFSSDVTKGVTSQPGTTIYVRVDPLCAYKIGSRRILELIVSFIGDCIHISIVYLVLFFFFRH